VCSSDLRITTLFITHSMLEAAALGTRILLMGPSARRIGASLVNHALTGSEAEKMAMAASLKEKFRETLS
jgi:ABC-type nitrate/sulfonate/bicarbonate transport system ATPase subunit